MRSVSLKRRPTSSIRRSVKRNKNWNRLKMRFWNWKWRPWTVELSLTTVWMRAGWRENPVGLLISYWRSLLRLNFLNRRNDNDFSYSLDINIHFFLSPFPFLALFKTFSFSISFVFFFFSFLTLISSSFTSSWTSLITFYVFYEAFFTYLI